MPLHTVRHVKQQGIEKCTNETKGHKWIQIDIWDHWLRSFQIILEYFLFLIEANKKKSKCLKHANCNVTWYVMLTFLYINNWDWLHSFVQSWKYVLKSRAVYVPYGQCVSVKLYDSVSLSLACFLSFPLYLIRRSTLLCVFFPFHVCVCVGGWVRGGVQHDNLSVYVVRG